MDSHISVFSLRLSPMEQIRQYPGSQRTPSPVFPGCTKHQSNNMFRWIVINTKYSHTGTHSTVLWRCWLGGRKGIRPVKNRMVGFWCGCLSGARCRLGHGPADATATLSGARCRLGHGPADATATHCLCCTHQLHSNSAGKPLLISCLFHPKRSLVQDLTQK